MTNLTIEQLAEKLGGKLWEKGDLKRIYLDRGYNTKKMSTKTYVYQREDGTFGVSCYIDCPSQDFNWIKSQQNEVIEGVTEDINEAFSDTVYVMVDEAAKIVNYKGEEVTLNLSDSYLIEAKAKQSIGDHKWTSYISIPREEFEIKVAELWATDKAEKEAKKLSEPIIEKVESTIEFVKEFEIGASYSHNRMGVGVATKEDENLIYIKFSEGEKVLMKKFVKLEKI